MSMKLPRIWPSTLEQGQAKLAQWFVTPLGQEFLKSEQALLEHILPDLFGYHALQLGQVTPCHLLQGSRILHKLLADKQPSPVDGLSALCAAPEQLPFANDSVDVVLVHHLLEAVNRPHAILREAARITIPEGYLLIVGFNPWSLWGLWRFCRMPWSQNLGLTQSISAQRLHDWLTLLDFEVVGVETAYFRPPINSPALRQHLVWLETLGQRYWPQGGASYVMLAQKKSSCITPIRLRQKMMSLVPSPLATEARQKHPDLQHKDSKPSQVLSNLKE